MKEKRVTRRPNGGCANGQSALQPLRYKRAGEGGWRSVRSGRIQSLQRLPVLGLRSQRCWGKCYFRAVPSACLGILHISKDRVWSESTGGGQTGSWGESLRLCWEPSSQGQERKDNVPAPARGAHSLLNVAILGQVPRGRSLLPQSSCEEVAVGAVWRQWGVTVSITHTGFPTPSHGLPTYSPGFLSLLHCLEVTQSPSFLPSSLTWLCLGASFLSLPGGSGDIQDGSQPRNVQRPKVYFHPLLPQG